MSIVVEQLRDLIGVPEHHGIEGNAKADLCVVIESLLDEIMAYNDVRTPSVIVTNRI